MSGLYMVHGKAVHGKGTTGYMLRALDGEEATW